MLLFISADILEHWTLVCLLANWLAGHLDLKDGWIVDLLAFQLCQ
jgi:hypothetical protein